MILENADEEQGLGGNFLSQSMLPVFKKSFSLYSNQS